MVKNTPVSAGDTRDVGSIPGLGKSPGEGNDNSLQYSCLENSTDRGAWQASPHGVSESDKRPSTHTHTHTRQGEFTVMLLRLTLQVLEHDFSNSLLIVLIFYSTNPENVPDPATFEV